MSVRHLEWHEVFVQRDAEAWIGRGTLEQDAFDNLFAQMFPSHAAREALERFLMPTEEADDGPVSQEADVPAEAEAVTPAALDALEETPATPSAQPVTPVEQPETLDEATALERIAKLSTKIDGEHDYWARSTPERQRLKLIIWACRARSYEERCSEDAVLHGVRRIVKRISDLAKDWWCGNVGALRLEARPHDFRGMSGRVPETWKEAAEFMVDTLVVLCANGEGNVDDFGWPIADPLEPAPRDAETIVAECLIRLDALVGPIAGGTTPDLTDAGRVELLRIARKLRWTRLAAENSIVWGRAVGRLRWWTRRGGAAVGAAEIIRTLDPAWVPDVSWARLVGDAEAERRKAHDAEVASWLASNLPAPGGDATTLVAWLMRAFDVLDRPRLAEMLRPLRTEVCALDPETLPGFDRRLRRRLTDLVRALNAESEETSAAAPPLDEGSDEDAPMSVDEPHAAIWADLRLVIGGWRLLFVSNRSDPDLEARLVERLGVDVTWCEHNDRKLQAMCKRVSAGAFEIVLAATGFIDHRSDGLLARAAAAASVPYVRADRARPLACARAIARELGVDRGIGGRAVRH